MPDQIPQPARPDPSEVDGPNGTVDAMVDWAGLPDPVRSRLAELAAGAIGELCTIDVPAPLRPVARFAPAKRARLVAGPLVAALAEDDDFREAVAGWWRGRDAAAVDPDAPDPVAAAAAAVLLSSETAGYRIREVAERAEALRWRAERDTALARVDKLAGELERLRAELTQVRAALRDRDALHSAELAKVRGRLRDAVARARQAERAADAAGDGIRAERDEVGLALAEAGAELDRERARSEVERARADRATAEVAAARQSAREARAADEVRLLLLVDTLSSAVTGLRRELALGSGGARPADLVAGVRSPGDGLAVGASDPAALDRLLALRTVHLVVDGYNVTKTGYPELTLAAQRDRLVAALAVLAARTGAETTVVFDGAEVVRVPSSAPRGVRVLFSASGVSADDVIRSLVATEPQGRPVVVVTSDRAVADSVRRRGAHPVSSAVLLARFARI